MQQNLTSLFPELNDELEHYFSREEFRAMPYFEYMSGHITEKEMKSAINRSIKEFTLMDIKKGTVICTAGSNSEAGFILLHGTVAILRKKNSREKLNQYPKHSLPTGQEKVEFLCSTYGIPEDKAEILLNDFYEEKLTFKYLDFHQLYGEGYFGFSEMVRNTIRVQTVIATTDSTIMKMTKQSFDRCLRDFELKREDFILSKFFSNTKKELADEIRSKAGQLLNSAVMVKYDKDTLIEKEGTTPEKVYLILKGECQLHKKVSIQIPKKFLQPQNKSQVVKQTEVKLARISQDNLVGQTEVMLNMPKREFTIYSAMNETILVQFDHNIFMKVMSELSQLLKESTILVKCKYSSTMNSYEKQKKIIVQSFLLQIQEFQSHKKQKSLSTVLKDTMQTKKYEMFQVFNQHGVFYRDSFQKLQGFEFFETSQNPKRSPIKKGKVNSSKMTEQPRNPQQQNSIFTNEKLLLSPKIEVNNVECMTRNYYQSLHQQSAKSTKLGNPSKKVIYSSQRSRPNFQEFKKDQNVYKRVLIKNGIYPKDKTIDRANASKPIVHQNFDEVIKQCMSRKNMHLKQAIHDNNNELLKQSYQHTVNALQRKAISVQKFRNFASVSTCRGTDELKKKMQRYRNTRNEVDSSLKQRLFQDDIPIESCLGVNREPKTSHIKNRTEAYSDHQPRHHKAEKIVLLNHMMKPITYKFYKEV